MNIQTIDIKKYLISLILVLLSFVSFSQKEKQYIDSLIQKGNAYTEKDDYNKAINLYLKCLRFSDSISSNYGLYLSNINLGNIYTNWGENKSASKHFIKALQSAIKNNDTIQIAGALNSIGNSYSNMAIYDSALIYYERAFLKYKSTTDLSNTAGTLNNIGTIYIKAHNDISKGNEYFLEAYEISKKTKNIKLMALLTINIASNYKKMEDYYRALHYIDISAFFADSLKSKVFIMRVENSYAEVYEKLDQYKKAYEHYLKYHKLQQEVFGEEKHRQFAEMKTKYETEKKEQQIIALNKSSELDQERIRKQRILIFSSISVLLLIVFVLLLFYRQSKLKSELLSKDKQRLKLEKQNLMDKVSHKEREMVTTTMHLVQKNELLQKLKQQLDKITFDKFDSNLDNLSKDIDLNINVEKDWSAFRVHFEEVNPDFFNLLTKKFPKLTQNDLKICAYIKIGLSNKEIAQLLNILPDSVKSTKKRLKKKLSLTVKDSLIDFIRKF